MAISDYMPIGDAAEPGTLASHIGIYDNTHEPVTIWNRPATTIGMSIAFATGSFLCIGMRLYTRIYVLRSPGWDDYLISLFFVLGALGTICMVIGPSYGAGRHFLTLTDEEIRTTLLLFYLANAAFVTSTSVIKLSLLVQYLRIFSAPPSPASDSAPPLAKTQTDSDTLQNYEQLGDYPVIRKVCKVCVWITSIWCVIISFFAWFPCFPLRAHWDWTALEGAKCWGYGSHWVTPFYATFIVQSTTNFLLDVVVLGIPMVLLFHHRTETSTKLRLAGVLALGLCVNVFAIWRLVLLVRHKVVLDPTFDLTWYTAKLDIVGMMEVNLSCMAGSVPVFWPILRKWSFNDILVTHEVKVEVAHRYRRRQHPHQHLDSDDGTSADVNYSESNYNKASHARDTSVGSRASQSRLARVEQHYQDEYVMEHIDPLRGKKVALVESEITAGRS